MGHIGLTPQSFHQMGGFKVQGRGQGAAERLLADARALQDAGAYSLVLEGIPSEIAARITDVLDIPTIGIGAGPQCDGQVLVIYDLLGMIDTFKPKFVRRYDDLAERIRSATRAYADDVRSGSFPAERESFAMTARTAAKKPAATAEAAPAKQAPTKQSPDADSSAELGGLYASVSAAP